LKKEVVADGVFSHAMPDSLDDGVAAQMHLKAMTAE
jgi:hypothetical protein